MILEFSTKRDANGNRKYVGVDTEKRVYSRERGHWYSREDVIEISRADRTELIVKFRAEGYKEIEFLY